MQQQITLFSLMLTIKPQTTLTQSIIRMDAMLAMVLQPDRNALMRFVRNYNKLKLTSLPGLLSSEDVVELMNLISDYKSDLDLEQEANWDSHKPGQDEYDEFIDNSDIIAELDEAYEKLTNRN